MPGFAVEGVSFSYGGADVLRDINLVVREGEFLCLLGPSGSGKSTLQRLLAGLELPGSGRITWKGRPITGPSTDRGVVFQDYSLYPWMTLAENVSLALEQSSPELGRKARHTLAEEGLAAVGLAGTAHKHPFELSGGMQQRAAIARTLALQSSAILMDEPFGALDPLNRARLQDLVTGIWQDASPRRTIVFVTHDVDEALLLGDRVVVLGASPGRIIGEALVPFPRPRLRRELLEARAFQELRETVSALYRHDVLEQIEEPWAMHGQGEGI